MPTLLVFLKYPASGQVKTRLAEVIGPQQAADLYREWIGIVLQNVQAARSSARLVACYDGAPKEAFAPWHGLVDDWWPQPAGGLGDRLDAAFNHWQVGGVPAIAIGTDCLDVSSELVEAAFTNLRDKDAIPAFPVVHAEVLKARTYMAEQVPQSDGLPGVTPLQTNGGRVSNPISFLVPDMHEGSGMT